ncbi:MAG: response regulator, partial [Hungatella hathewayi]|nr:response regulator [Hungatella hathewayi]
MFQMIIADDESAIRNGLRDLFPWEELQVQIVCTAANGRAALDYVENHPVDLVLADIRMPGMDGLELARTLNESYPSVCMILISAYTDFEYARKAMRYGVREYITKPVDYKAFLSTMRRILAELTPQEEEQAS